MIIPVRYLGRTPDQSILDHSMTGGFHVSSCPDDDDQDDDPVERRYASNQEEGICLVIEGGIVVAVQIYGEAREGYSPWRGGGIDGLTFDMARDRVRDLLGAPTASMGAQILPVLGSFPPWDSFDMMDHRTHVEYADDEGRGIRMVTFTRS